jgi:hypothetical protein
MSGIFDIHSVLEMDLYPSPHIRQWGKILHSWERASFYPNDKRFFLPNRPNLVGNHPLIPAAKKKRGGGTVSETLCIMCTQDNIQCQPKYSHKESISHTLQRIQGNIMQLLPRRHRLLVSRGFSWLSVGIVIAIWALRRATRSTLTRCGATWVTAVLQYW